MPINLLNINKKKVLYLYGDKDIVTSLTGTVYKPGAIVVSETTGSIRRSVRHDLWVNAGSGTMKPVHIAGGYGVDTYEEYLLLKGLIAGSGVILTGTIVPGGGNCEYIPAIDDVYSDLSIGNLVKPNSSDLAGKSFSEIFDMILFDLQPSIVKPSLTYSSNISDSEVGTIVSYKDIVKVNYDQGSWRLQNGESGRLSSGYNNTYNENTLLTIKLGSNTITLNGVIKGLQDDDQKPHTFLGTIITEYDNDKNVSNSISIQGYYKYYIDNIKSKLTGKISSSVTLTGINDLDISNSLKHRAKLYIYSSMQLPVIKSWSILEQDPLTKQYTINGSWEMSEETSIRIDSKDYACICFERKSIVANNVSFKITIS